MLARHHAAFGVVAAEGLLLLHVPIATALPAGLAVMVGSVLPDLDEPGSRVSRSFPVLSTHVSTLVRQVVPKHRGGESHSIGTALIMGTLVGLACVTTPGRVIVGFILGTLLMRVVVPRGLRWAVPFSTLIGIGISILLMLHAAPVAVGAGLALGITIHVLTDLWTNSGVALLWPLSSHRFAPNLFSTGSWIENVIGGAVWILALVLILNLRPEITTIGHHVQTMVDAQIANVRGWLHTHALASLGKG